MSWQRLTIATFGEIGHLASPNGPVVARARYRDWDGKTRLVQATGDTRKSAERVLKAKLADRSLFQPSSSALTSDSPFPDLVAYWLEDLELEDRRSKRTLQLYERNMQTLVVPAFGNLICGRSASPDATTSSNSSRSRATTVPNRPASCSDLHSGSPSGMRCCHATRWTTSRDCTGRRRRRMR